MESGKTKDRTRKPSSAVLIVSELQTTSTVTVQSRPD